MKSVRPLALAISVMALTLSGACLAHADNETKVAGTDDSFPGAALGDMYMGKADAPVTIIEYASITCSHCREFHEDVYPTIKARVDAGDVKFVFREFPTAPQVVAFAGFSAARCSGEDNYFAMLDDFFVNQETILEAARAGKAKAELKSVAKTHGLSEADFDTCVKDKSVYDSIVDMIDLGHSEGVTSTPTLFMNGKLLGADARTAEGMSALIDAALDADSGN